MKKKTDERKCSDVFLPASHIQDVFSFHLFGLLNLFNPPTRPSTYYTIFITTTISHLRYVFSSHRITPRRGRIVAAVLVYLCHCMIFINMQSTQLHRIHSSLMCTFKSK